MDLQHRVAQLPPARRRRVEHLAVTAAAVCAVLSVFVVTLSSATVRLWWGRSTFQVAISAGGAALALLLCAVAARNAHRTLRAPRSAADRLGYGVVSLVSRER